eukprot:Plantae.Rhodophyta-Purpureofilum_apyrenoidigerum.ctg17283.p1 GENE.Plantae.Rhodophyta-Purpureofilum_apyrenoidigerum.ctg17283~~Plantae.Rhodophyta-Purpureofilum_apyrenoidigerum.ctg17283.p1  ORF type:complete len:818 (-),score=148.80 Plantae.Rhodophyta-Purpureofilum_apyrenoidigerum.ctg17283:91-2544(-)
MEHDIDAGGMHNRFDQTANDHEDNFSAHDSDAGVDENFTLSQDGDGGFSSRILPTRKYTKLETISGQTVRSMMFVHNIVLLIGIAWTVMIIVLSLTAWKEERTLPDPPYNVIKTVRFPTSYTTFSAVLGLITFLYLLAVMITYCVRIAQQAITVGGVQLEMIWVLLLTLAMCLYANPFPPLANMLMARSIAFIKQEQYFTAYLIQSISFSIASTWYIWTTAHSYRYIDRRPGVLFYLPKLLVIVAITVIRIISFIRNNIVMNEMPFISVFRMVAYHFQGQDPFKTPFLFNNVIALTAVELLALAWTLFDVFKTRTELKKADYMLNRSKQIGFLFFLYFNTTFYIMYWIVTLVLSCASVPESVAAASAIGFWNLSTGDYYVPFSLLIMLCSYITVTATVNLPAHFKSYLFFFSCKQCTQSLPDTAGAVGDELEPITYRSTEPPSYGGIVEDLRSNCFTMQTHVVMFNFAWLVYYYGTKKFEKLQLKQDVFTFEIAAYFADKPTDTHVIVVDGSDRIVISFRGTTSGKNLKTDIRIAQRQLNQVIPSTKLESTLPARQELMNSKLWKASRVHSGFSAAYLSVGKDLIAKVKELYETKQRPIFLTGHSLGGSLANLCSLDLYVSLGLQNKEIFVSTFGAPRVGNKPFQMMYDEAIPSCWRIVVGPDMVAKLPRFGYKHCGKKVLLTASGDLFIDPNALELKLWSGEKPGMLYHRKASYLLAMRAWCDINHGEEYVPEFWAWPFSPDDSRRFSHVLNAQSKSSTAYSSKRQERKEERGTRLLQRDAMISQLDSNRRSTMQMWADLSRKLLAEDAQYYDYLE